MAKPKWGILVASKRKLRGVLTGEKASSPDQEDEILADDLISGLSGSGALLIERVRRRGSGPGFLCASNWEDCRAGRLEWPYG